MKETLEVLKMDPKKREFIEKKESELRPIYRARYPAFLVFKK